MKSIDIGKDMLNPGEQAAWSKIEHSFSSVKPVKPRKGFATRWLLVEQKHALAEQKRRELWLAVGNGTAMLAILCVIAITLWPQFSLPGTVFAGALDSLLNGLAFLVASISLGLSLFRSFSLLVWLGVATAFFSLLAMWTALFSRTSVQVEN